MNAAAKDIATLLDGVSSLGLTLGTDLFYARTPPKPQDCVSIHDNPGEPPMTTLQKSTSNYFYSSVMVRVRNINYDDGMEQIRDVMDYLHALSNEVVDGTYYALIKAMTEPQVLAWDDNDRVILIVNFEVQRRIN